MKILTVLMTTLLSYSSLPLFPVFAGISLGELMSNEDWVSKSDAVVVGKVRKINPTRANTRAEPPEVVLEVKEVLKGNLNVKEIVGIWNPRPSSVDTASEIEAEGKQALPPPEKGSEWIVCAGSTNRADIYGFYPQWPNAQKTREWVLFQVRGNHRPKK